jgi:hypothetical protein
MLFFDLETQKSAQQVGGWHNAHLMRVALAVIWDSRDGRFRTFREADVHALIEELASADLVIGFNVLGFDYQVLRGYSDRDLSALPTFDLLDAIHARLGFRLALGHLGEETLGVPKTADGLQSLRWWQEGRIDEIERYCQADVALLRDLFEHARQQGHLLFRTRGGERVRLPLRLSLEELLERARSGTPAASAPRPSQERRAPRDPRPSVRRRAPRVPRPSVERRAPAHAAVEQLEVEQHHHVAHGWRELADEAARIRQRRQTHHVLDREVHLADPPRQLATQPVGVLREGRVDRVGVEEQVNAPLTDVEEPFGIQHGPPYRQDRPRD